MTSRGASTLIDASEIQRALQLQAIFDSEVAQKREDLLSTDGKLVHYTSSDTAFRILDGKAVWMRNVQVMNDYMEVRHGIDSMIRFFRPVSEEFPDVGQTEMRAAFEEQWPGLFSSVIDQFNYWLPHMEQDSYITSLSIHPKEENNNGRLSMWRSYGMGPVGVALVINPRPFYEVEGDIGAYSNPVVYRTPEQVFSCFRQVAARLRESKQFLAGIDRDRIHGLLFDLMLNTALCCKHPGFSEELEWRIMHVDGMWTGDKLDRDTVVVRGVPQLIMKIPLGPATEGGIPGMQVHELLDRVIIGPTDYPDVVRKAYIRKLRDLDVPDPEQKVFASEIPLRN